MKNENLVSKTFFDVVNSNKNARIKLIGDSITHGVGGTGFEQNGETIIPNKFKRNPNGYCWANLFKDLVKDRFGATVINNGCSGTEVYYIINNFDALVDNDDDIIICTIGTNNRHQYLRNEPLRTPDEQRAHFKLGITTLYKMIKARNIPVIFMANIPASSENEKDGEDYKRLIHMNDIRDQHLAFQKEYGVPLIDLYSAMSSYCYSKGEIIDTYLADGLHPNDTGYKIMFDIITNELGIK